MNKFFIEIGSSDFDTLLPLAENGWSGIVVEPVTELLDNLDIHTNVVYENLAILDKDGISTIRFCDPKRIPDTEKWMRGIGNVTQVNHFWEGAAVTQIMVKRDVRTITLDTLIKKYNVSKIDFLKIDTEGSEWVILKDYSWIVKPTFMKVETVHWPTHEKYFKTEIFRTMETVLQKNDYIVYYEKNDLYAIR